MIYVLTIIQELFSKVCITVMKNIIHIINFTA